LDGTVSSSHGLWHDSRYLLSYFSLVHQEKVVVGDFNFKSRNLKGMRCKVIHHDSRQEQSFVEFDDNVGGGNADGLGKTGCCVVLPSELLENVDEQSKNESGEKKKIVENVSEAVKLSIAERELFAIKAQMEIERLNIEQSKEKIVVEQVRHDPGKFYVKTPQGWTFSSAGSVPSTASVESLEFLEKKEMAVPNKEDVVGLISTIPNGSNPGADWGLSTVEILSNSTKPGKWLEWEMGARNMGEEVEKILKRKPQEKFGLSTDEDYLENPYKDINIEFK
jgi:hypothetical protein